MLPTLRTAGIEDRKKKEIKSVAMYLEESENCYIFQFVRQARKGFVESS